MPPLINAKLRAAGVTTEEKLLTTSATDLLEVLDPQELYELIMRLRARGEGISGYPGRTGKVPGEREVEIFRLRIVEGRTLKQAGEAVGLGRERVRQIMRSYFGLPPFT